MDGNGRWAKARGLPRLKGHEQGAESVRAVLPAARKAGVEFITLYAFSVENWKRPAEEVNGLMKLLSFFMRRYERDFHENKTRLRILGRREDLPSSVNGLLAEIEKATEHYTDHQLILALSYGGRTEIAAAAAEIARKAKAGTLDPADITEQTVADNLYLPDVPDPDLIIRTSGEMRLSNFLLWQCSYSELYVTKTLWPDFREPQFAEAVEEYRRRHRRFGGI